MSNIQFDEESRYARPLFNSEKRSWLANLVIKTGLAKDSAGAQKVLLVVFMLAVLGTIFIWWPSGTSPTSNSVPVVPLSARHP